MSHSRLSTDTQSLTHFDDSLLRLDAQPRLAERFLVQLLDELELHLHLSRQASRDSQVLDTTYASAHLAGVGDGDDARLRLDELDVIEAHVGDVERHLRQELVLESVQVLHDVVVGALATLWIDLLNLKNIHPKLTQGLEKVQH